MLDLGRTTRLHETQLASSADNLREVLYPYFGEPVNGSVRLNGRISIGYKGRELLGPDYWFEFVTLGSLYHLVCEGKPHYETFGQRSYGIVVAPHKDGVMFEVQQRDGATGRRQILPYRELVQEWCLMEFRLARIGAELGDVTSTYHCDNPLGAYHCDKYLELIGEERLQYTATAPLEKLLSDPVPF